MVELKHTHFDELQKNQQRRLSSLCSAQPCGCQTAIVVAFNVLARDIDLGGHILCEASAGTGKTFTIEHLFIRRLLSVPNRSVKEIAVLTFTNAVAKELTLRLRRALDKAISDLKTANKTAADYIIAILDAGQQDEAIYTLELARDGIEYAAIDTIHGFCHRCLSEYEKNSAFATGADIVFAIEEFFRDGLDGYPQDELNVILKEYRGDFAKLTDDLATTLWEEREDSFFERLKKRCCAFVTQRLSSLGLYSLHNLLIRMESKMGDSAFTHYLKRRFSCVIVDEFQDTDPRQWNIIQTLIAGDWSGVLYLVGDPKQAIYSFRQADVYCYMQAKSIKDQTVVSLTKNFRSSANLVSALNTLFSQSSIFQLPKLGLHLDVPKIDSAERSENLVSDNVGAIHFFQASLARGRKKKWPTEELESDYFFPFIAKEIVSLGLPLEHFAILVKDRYQADRIEAFLEERGIVSHSWRKRSVCESEASSFLERLIRCVANVRDRNALIDLVIHPPFSYSSARCMQLHTDLDFWAAHVEHVLMLRGEKFHLTRLVQQFLQNCWPEHGMTMKELLWQNKEFLYDLEYLVELCSTHADACYANSCDAVLEYIAALRRLPQSEKEQLSCRYDPYKKAVQILTLHASKGLEFEVVFALGLANRPPKAEGDLAELDAEKLRQFYVAATRAKRRLYLPVAYELDARPVAPGMASAMELFLEHKDVQTLVEGSSGTITASILKPNQPLVTVKKELSTTTPLLLEPLPVSSKKYHLHSFTSMSRHVSKVLPEQSMPVGIEVGILLHEFLKNGTVNPELFGTALEGYEEQVSTLLARARDVSLGDFSLADVDPKRMSYEAPFYATVDGRRYMRGSIDLFFEHNNKFYIIDWKSNALESYCQAALQAEIGLQNYGLQAKIYTDALLQYVGKTKADFGGFYFVFLRGLPEGVYRYGD